LRVSWPAAKEATTSVPVKVDLQIPRRVPFGRHLRFSC